MKSSEDLGENREVSRPTAASLVKSKNHGPASAPLQEFLCLRCDGKFMAAETFPSCPACYPATALFEAKRAAAHRLAMLALQSDRYAQDAEYRDATDDVLAFSFPASPQACPNNAPMTASEPRPSVPAPEAFAGLIPAYREDWTIAQNILAATAAMKKGGTFENNALCWNPGELELLAMFAIDAKYKLAAASPLPEVASLSSQLERLKAEQPPPRPAPSNAQYEPPFPAHETAVVSIRYPYHTAHPPTELCAIQEPHLIEDCGEFER